VIVSAKHSQPPIDRAKVVEARQFRHDPGTRW